MSVVRRNACCLLLLLATGIETKLNQHDKEKLNGYREEVRSMFTHAYDSYLNHAYPYDELRPLSCDGVDTWGSYSLTLIDALDTLAVMGNYSEFGRVYHLVSERENFDSNINVSVFETNIRIVGGLLSAHLMAKRAGVELEKGWPCNGPLLRLAEDAALRLLPAFDTPTGMPYGTVNLRHGVPEGETPITCTAGVGTFIVEFGSLSRLTGNPVYEDTAMRALGALWHRRSGIGLLGNHIDVLTGRWTAVEAGIGAGVDSYYEYLAKGSSLLNRPELSRMFSEGREALDRYLRKDDWYFWVNMKNGQVTLPLFQSLEAFWPGTLSMVGDLEPALKSLHNYHQVWKQYGFAPEFYNVAQGGISANREGYPLRPELIESIMQLYRATGDPWLVDAGADILKSIQHSAYTPCGYATVKNVRTHTLEDRMESFFLAETVKYLYLLFDVDNFIHNPGTTATVHETPHGKCILDAGGYIFNTEAHPVDPAALACCSELSSHQISKEISNHLVDILNPTNVRQFRGDLVPERIQEIEKNRRLEKDRMMSLSMEQMRKLEVQRREKREADVAQQAAAEADIVANEEAAASEPSSSEEEEDEGLPDNDTKADSAHLDEPDDLSAEQIVGIVQPESMPSDSLPKPTNKLVEAVNSLTNSLLDRFMPVHSYNFDLELFANRVKNDARYPVNESWLTDYSALSCPALKYTDRFLIHGEFFTET